MHGICVYRDFMIGPSDIKDAKGKTLFSIGGLKAPDQEPLLYTQKACIAYVREKVPFKPSMRVDPYGGVHRHSVEWHNLIEDKICNGEYDDDRPES
jgi:hypothetical protein